VKDKLNIFLLNHATFTLGIFVFPLSFIFLLKSQLAIGLILLLICSLLITLRVVVTIDMKTMSIVVCNKMLFKSYNRKSFRLKRGSGKVIIINSINEVFGINSKSNTFFSYDLLYQSNNYHKAVLYTSTNEMRVYKIANFLSANLNLELEYKTINNSKI
jgi:hypothetical protein